MKKGDTIHTFTVFLLFGTGLVCIIWGGDKFVDAAARIAEISGIPPFVIGATVVSVATTLPELLVSVMAAVNGQPDMAAGNAVGSVTANTALIMGLAVLLAPSTITRRGYMKKSVILICAIILLWLFSLNGRLTLFGSAGMLGLFAYYIYDTLITAKAELVNTGSAMPRGRGEVVKTLLYFFTGAAAIILGSRLLVDNGTVIARDILDVDERVVSLTLVAVGTSLPELVTAISAVAKKQTALTAGNILGANIIDTLLILPVCSLIGGGMSVSRGTVMTDLPFCLAAVVIMLVPALIKERFTRLQGLAALLLYILYLTKICFSIVL